VDWVGKTSDLIVSVGALTPQDQGSVRYEWCDSNNHYGSWTVNFKGKKRAPLNTASPSPSPSPSTPVSQQCAQGQSLFVLPQQQSQIPADLGSPSLTCANPGTSTCSLCAPPTPVPSSGGTFMFSVLCQQLNAHSNWKGYSPITVKGSYLSPSLNYTATVTGGGSGWQLFEWCDSKGQYGSYVVAFGKAVSSK